MAQAPAMLAFLDAGVIVKGAPNHNFAREIMEMFTLGEGHYSEADVREAALAFTRWITPGLLIARGNFACDMVYPDINFIPPDRYPSGEFKIGELGDKLAQGLDVNGAARLDGMAMNSRSMQLADRHEEFNTRLASYCGWASSARSCA